LQASASSPSRAPAQHVDSVAPRAAQLEQGAVEAGGPGSIKTENIDRELMSIRFSVRFQIKGVISRISQSFVHSNKQSIVRFDQLAVATRPEQAHVPKSRLSLVRRCRIASFEFARANRQGPELATKFAHGFDTFAARIDPDRRL